MESGTMDWTVIGVGIALAGLILVTTRGIRAEIRDMNRTSHRSNWQKIAVRRMDILTSRVIGI